MQRLKKGRLRHLECCAKSVADRLFVGLRAVLRLPRPMGEFVPDDPFAVFGANVLSHEHHPKAIPLLQFPKSFHRQEPYGALPKDGRCKRRRPSHVPSIEAGGLVNHEGRRFNIFNHYPLTVAPSVGTAQYTHRSNPFSQAKPAVPDRPLFLFAYSSNRDYESKHRQRCRWPEKEHQMDPKKNAAPLTQLAEMLEGFAAAVRKTQATADTIAPETPEEEAGFAEQVGQTTAIVAAAGRLFLVDEPRLVRELAFLSAVANSVGRIESRAPTLEIVKVDQCGCPGCTAQRAAGESRVARAPEMVS